MIKDILFVVVVLVGALGLLAGVAYLLQRRKKPILEIPGEEEILPAPASNGEKWVLRVYVFLLIAVTLAAVLTNHYSWMWITLGLLVLGIVLRVVLEVAHILGYLVNDIRDRQVTPSGSAEDSEV